MANSTDTFGRHALQASSIDAFLELEHTFGHAERFAQLDTLLGHLVTRALQGERLVQLTWDKVTGHAVKLQGVTPRERTLINQTFAVAEQQARGAWFLPEEVSLKLGVVNLPATLQEHGRYAINIAHEERAKVPLNSTPDALLLWSLLEPFFTTLFIPFKIRSEQEDPVTPAEQLAQWQQVDALLAALGFSVQAELAVMRYGGGWHRLDAAGMVAARQQLMDALRRQITPQLGARYRAYCLQTLISAYYQKAQKTGRTKRTQVITKSLQRPLAGFLGGDWLAFLNYVGEEPHPDEQVVTTLPETRIYASAKARAAEVAAQQGVPVAEVERIMATFWQQQDATSPVERRVALLERYWQLLDQAHMRQVPGMQSLWGLVEDVGRIEIEFIEKPNAPYQPGRYRQILPNEVIDEIELLWGTMMLRRWPERRVSAIYPQMQMAETFGPALSFWHGLGLTAWFICEGPYSRTDLAGIPEYYRREATALSEMGFPLPSQLFEELRRAERQLGRPRPITHSRETDMTSRGITVTVSSHIGERRDGFQILRDIITHHRQNWAKQYLVDYLRMRWEVDIREAARTYHVMLSDRGKPPTPKQYAKHAVTATNHWFGGDLAALYRAFGEKAAMQPQYTQLIPQDRQAFVRLVYEKLGGKPYHGWQGIAESPTAAELQRQEYDRFNQFAGLACESLWYLQLEEALGHPPTLKDFGPDKFKWLAKVLSEDIETAWDKYARVVKAVCGSNESKTLIPSSTILAKPSLKPDPKPSQENQPPRKRSFLDRLLGR